MILRIETLATGIPTPAENWKGYLRGNVLVCDAEAVFRPLPAADGIYHPNYSMGIGSDRSIRAISAY